MKDACLIVIVGPTGIGKTDLAIQLAHHYESVIISGDSRQIYQEMKIGTACPSVEQLKEIPHFLIGSHSITDYYSAFEYEQDALRLTSQLFNQYNPIIVTGGSMMYIDALCKGIDDIPTIDQELRDQLLQQFQEQGLDPFRRMLKQLDPDFYQVVDLKNHKRVLHAVEVCLMSGKPYSSLRKNTTVSRPFQIIKIGLDMEREVLYSRINQRVDQMMELGLLEEAQNLYPLKHLNALNTVGYKELFDYMDGLVTLQEAVSLIKRNTRRYAKRQLSWFRRDTKTTWFHPQEDEKIINFVIQTIYESGRPVK